MDYIPSSLNADAFPIQYRDRMKHEDSNTIHFVAINYKKSEKKT